MVCRKCHAACSNRQRKAAEARAAEAQDAGGTGAPQKPKSVETALKLLSEQGFNEQAESIRKEARQIEEALLRGNPAAHQAKVQKARVIGLEQAVKRMQHEQHCR